MGLEDASDYGRLLAEPSVHPFVLEDGPLAADAVVPRVVRNQAEWAQRAGGTWALVHEDRFVGYVALHGLGQPCIAVSYAVAPAWQRRGLGREAVTAVLGLGGALCFSGVQARTHVDNEASASLLVTCGFMAFESTTAPDHRVFHWRRSTPAAVAVLFAAALEHGDWAGVRALLVQDCVYDCRGTTTTGAEAIACAYRVTDDWVRETFEGLRYDSRFDVVGSREILMTFRDRMAHGPHRLDFRCQQRLSISAAGDQICGIEHVDLPGERDKADRFNRACGVTRP